MAFMMAFPFLVGIVGRQGAAVEGDLFGRALPFPVIPVIPVISQLPAIASASLLWSSCGWRCRQCRPCPSAAKWVYSALNQSPPCHLLLRPASGPLVDERKAVEL